jgi:hypothetical protein
MMQTADLRERDDLAGTEWVYRAALRTILVEREMRSRFVVILKVGRQHTAQVTRSPKNDDVIETLAAHRANDALDVGVLEDFLSRQRRAIKSHDCCYDFAV